MNGSVCISFLSRGRFVSNNEESKEPRRPFLSGPTARIVGIAAFAGALLGLLSLVPPLAGAFKSAWCTLFVCRPESRGTPPPGSIPAPTPQARVFTHAAFATLDGEGAPSGTISNIRVTIVDNKGKQPDAFVVEWTWSGSGGSQKGSQTVTIDLKSAEGGTLQSLRFGLDRSHCYRGGNNERHQGNLSASASLIAGIAVSVSRVEGRQGRC